jgi:regulator of cell morphogenesis and NO signaling
VGVDLERSLAELVLEQRAAARVLQRLGFDYCCGGRRSLRQACAEHGLDADTVAVFLEREADVVVLELRDWRTATVAELCAHIVDEHHRRLRWELPRLSELAKRAASAHGEVRPQLHDLRHEFEELRAELEEHIAEEEREVFPTLVEGGALDAPQLERLLHEHDGAGARLRRLRELADGYATADALCAAHRTLLEGLHGLDLDLHQHVHEENNILFPRTAAVSDRLRAEAVRAPRRRPSQPGRGRSRSR